MYQYSKLLLLLLSAILVTGTPFNFNKEIAISQDEKKAEPVEEEPTVYRLNGIVKPLSYDIRIVPDLEKFTFKGTVTITVFAVLSTNQIELHSKDLKISSVKLTKGAQPVEVKFVLDEPNEILRIESSQKLTYNTDYILTIEFEGVLKNDMKGFYKSSYIIDGKERWLATTQFEPTYARRAFPCFDEPRFRASFTIYVGRFENQKAISNMPRDLVLPKDSSIGNRVWEKFQKSPPMATYLVAFIVFDFSYIKESENRVGVWVRENAVSQASYALIQGTKLLKGMEDFTGISFELPKIDIVAVPDFNAGAMENWGLTTYREKYVLADQQTSCELNKAAITEVISHEFSHQWFGDYVTPAWWDYLWLNEGFATYFEYFNVAEIEPATKRDHIFNVEVVQTALHNEITKQRAMTSSITTNSEINGAFDVISYDKAGSVIRMLEHIVSPSTFRISLHDYLLNGHDNGGTVSPIDLWQAFDYYAYRDSPPLPPHLRVSDIMKTWTENIGFPLIKATRNYTTGKVEITQSTYKSPRAPKPLPDQEWIVPLTYTTKSELKFTETKPTLWSFANKVTTLKHEVSPEDWIILNIQQSGYYRVNYDYNNWKLIIAHLRQKHEDIHVLNRAQLIDDVINLASDGAVCFHRPFQLLQYLPNEKEMIPWYPAIIGMNTLHSKYEGTIAEGPLREYILNIIRGPYTSFGFDFKSTDSHVVKRIKPLFLSFACKMRLEECKKNSLDEYKKNKDDLNKIQPDLKRVIFCNALRYSDDQSAVFNNLWNFYLKIDSSYDKNLILMGLACTTNNAVIDKILSKLIDSKNKEIRDQDKLFIRRLFFSQIPTVTGSIAFVDSKVPTITELDESGISGLKDILNGIASNVKTEEQIKQLKNLEEKFKKLDEKKFGSSTKIIHDAYTKAAQNIEANKKPVEELKSILEEFLHPVAPETTPKPTKAPSSGASTIVSSFWSHLAVSLITLCYGLPVFRIFQLL